MPRHLPVACDRQGPSVGLVGIPLDAIVERHAGERLRPTKDLFGPIGKHVQRLRRPYPSLGPMGRPGRTGPRPILGPRGWFEASAEEPAG